MSSICLVDTSIFLNILNVPNRNNERNEILKQFQEYIELGCSFIIPMATVIETGNHIAQNGDGNTRREVAQFFVNTLEKTFTGEAPFRISKWLSQSEIKAWLAEFPSHAQRNKSSTRTTEVQALVIYQLLKSLNKIVQNFQ